MTRRSIFFGRHISDSILRRQAAPILVMLGATPFIDTNGPNYDFAIFFCQGAIAAAFSVLILYLLCDLISDEGWSRKKASDTGKVITLWLMAAIAIAHLF